MYSKLFFTTLTSQHAPLQSTPFYLSTFSFSFLPLESYAAVTFNSQPRLKCPYPSCLCVFVEALSSGWNILCSFLHVQNSYSSPKIQFKCHHLCETSNFPSHLDTLSCGPLLHFAHLSIIKPTYYLRNSLDFSHN